MSDRYLRIVLTVIAVELFWIGIKDIGTPAAAQAAQTQRASVAQTQPMPVVIRGIDLDAGLMSTDAARRSLPIYTTQTVKVDSDRPLPVVGAAPFTVQADRPLPVASARPLQIEAARPLPVEAVPYTPGRTPGE